MNMCWNFLQNLCSSQGLFISLKTFNDHMGVGYIDVHGSTHSTNEYIWHKKGNLSPHHLSFNKHLFITFYMSPTNNI